MENDGSFKVKSKYFKVPLCVETCLHNIFFVCFSPHKVEFLSLCLCARFLSSSPVTESFLAVDRVGRTWAARATISNNGCSPMRGQEGKTKAWQSPTVLHSVHTNKRTRTHTQRFFFIFKTQNRAIKFSVFGTHCETTAATCKYSVYTQFFKSKNRDAA